jgi:hypothetical protein
MRATTAPGGDQGRPPPRLFSQLPGLALVFLTLRELVGCPSSSVTIGITEASGTHEAPGCEVNPARDHGVGEAPAELAACTREVSTERIGTHPASDEETHGLIPSFCNNLSTLLALGSPYENPDGARNLGCATGTRSRGGGWGGRWLCHRPQES